MISSSITSSENLDVPHKQRVRILTYNTFLRPPLVHNNGDDYKNERCDLIISEILKEYDIICFQEVFGLFNMRKAKLKHKAFKQGFTYQAVSPSPSFFSTYMVDGGLLTISRYPILLHQFKEFPYGILSDNLSMKGILYTKIEIEGNILHLFNTHLQASYVGDESKVRATVKTRIDQMFCFRRFIQKILKEQNYTPQDLVVLAGDFNVDSRYEQGYSLEIFNDHQELKENLNFPQKYIEYDALQAIISNYGQDKLIDYLFETKKIHPITYADFEDQESGEKKPLEVQLTDQADLCSAQCLDYIFQLIPFQECQSNLELENPNVEKFFVQNDKVTQISDHYGVSIELFIKCLQQQSL